MAETEGERSDEEREGGLGEGGRGLREERRCIGRQRSHGMSKNVSGRAVVWTEFAGGETSHR